MFKSPTYMTTNQLNDSQLQLVMTLLYLWRNTYFLLAGCGCGIATCSAPVKSLPRKPPHIYWCRAQVRVPGAVEMFGMPCARSVVFFPPPFFFCLSFQTFSARPARPFTSSLSYCMFHKVGYHFKDDVDPKRCISGPSNNVYVHVHVHTCISYY